MHIQNLNSSITITSDVESRLVRRLDFLQDVFWNTPVYLINELLMDKIAPPRAYLHPECVRDILTSQDENTNVNTLLEKLERCRDSRNYALMGVYIYEVSGLITDIEEACGVPINSGSAIFVCNERVDSFCSSLSSEISSYFTDKRRFEIIFHKVAIHELAHAFMDGSSKKRAESGEIWHTVIEESLANAVAFEHFSPSETVVAGKSMAVQPLEYRGYGYWLKRFSVTPRGLASAWKRHRLLYKLYGAASYDNGLYDIFLNNKEGIKGLAIEILRDVI